MSKKKVLGRGLDALLGTGTPPPPASRPIVEQPAGERLLEIPVGQVDPNPFQPRESFNEETIADLAKSIKSQGLIQPIVVRQIGERYQLIAGERRLRASKLAGLPRIPARVMPGGDTEDLEKALVENLQREDLNPLFQARAYQKMMEVLRLTQEQVAERVGKSRAAVANTLRLLRLPEAIQGDVLAGRLSEGHARALLSIDGAKPQLDLRNQILRDGLSVRQTEELVRPSGRGGANGHAARPRKPLSSAAKPEASLRELEEQLTLRLGVRVRIQPSSARKGKIVLWYGSPDDFERVVEAMGVQAD